MKIVFEHAHPLPVKKYGGTERIIFWLMKELALMGHQVSLIGHPESDVSSIGVKLISKDPNLKDWRSLVPKDTDIIHLFYTPGINLDVPHVVTIEGNGRINEEFIKNTFFISRKHAEIHGGSVFVHNGIDLSEYPFKKKKNQNWEHFLFLAKASWKVKNLNDCIKACKKQKKHLHIAGGRKLTLSRRIHSYGMVDQKKKLELFNHTDALLWPVRWHEPFGIAIIEAMSMGLPVIGSPFGSLPELITPFNGFLVKNYNEFETVIGLKENKFNSEEIRAHVEKNFSSQKMATEYFKYYDRVCRGEPLNEVRPRYTLNDGPEVLQEF